MARLFVNPEELKSKVFNGNDTWVAPPGVTKVNVRGRGGPGQDESETYIEYYSEDQTNYYQTRTTPAQFVVQQAPTRYGYGPCPADGCSPVTPLPGNPTYAAVQSCYDFTDLSYWSYNEPTYGAAASAFGYSFPGAYGNTTASVVSVPNVTVTPGQSYPIRVPGGGQVIVEWYA